MSSYPFDQFQGPALSHLLEKTVLEGVGPNHAGSAYSRPPDGHAAMRMYIAASMDQNFA